MSRTEAAYQTGLIKRIQDRFPGSVVLKNDPNYRQGILDLTVLIGWFWGMFEVKAYRGAPSRPNQMWYVERMNEMSFAAIIYPENEEEVLNEFERTLRSREQVGRHTLLP